MTDGEDLGNLLWPRRCKHLEADMFATFSVLQMRDPPDKENGAHRTNGEVKLCPYCAGVLIGTIGRTLKEVPP